MKRTKSTAKISRISRKASQILEEQKKDYQKMVSRNVKKLGFKQGVKTAASEYRKEYGGTPKLRWEKAMKEAAKSCK